MDRALFAAATGMAAQQKNLDLLADNLANADVAGFKGSTEQFAALAAPDESGLGTSAIGERVVFTQGKLMKSNGAFDVAIDGPGFFKVSDARGRVAYTRDGEFSRAPDGRLENAAGWHLNGLRIPDDAVAVHVDEAGLVNVSGTHGTRQVGRVLLSTFPAPEHLSPIGGTLWSATPQAGHARTIQAGANGASTIRFGMLEQSNVSIVEAMMQILASQRAYEANAKGVQAADEMLRIANNLQRG